jgi:TPR repeat protein
MMGIHHYPGATLVTVLVSVFLFGCQIQHEKPTSAQIETVGMKAKQQADASAERKLMSWSAQNMPVAQRELACCISAVPQQRDDALRLFEQAARGRRYGSGVPVGRNAARRRARRARHAPAAAAPWYAQPAGHKHARAALALGLLYKNGDGRGARRCTSGALAVGRGSLGQSARDVPALQHLPRRRRRAARQPKARHCWKKRPSTNTRRPSRNWR